jgi:olefin beta-lactone synthetase
MISGMNANVARFLDEMAHRQGERCALRVPLGGVGEGGIRYAERSFAELAESSDRAAALLAGRGIGRGTRTLLMVKPGLPLIEICFALFKLGAVPVVIDPGMGLKGFLRCVRRTEPEALVGIPLAGVVGRLFRPSFRSVRTRMTVGRAWARQVSETTPWAEAAVAGADELAAILFTSGSTGPAKGVEYTHGMFDAQVRLIREAYAIEPGEVDLPMLPIFALFNPALGMTTIVPEMNPSRPASVDPARIVRAIHQNAVTNSFGSPVLWDRIATYCEAKGETLPTLRRVLMAGAPAPVSLLERMRALMPGGEVHTPYGATECLPVSTISAGEVLRETWERTLAGAGTCVGRAVPGVEIRIVPLGADGASCLPSGERGEILVTGPSVTRAYNRLPEATAAAKWRGEDGRTWHRMGDLGYLDADGRLWFCGRVAERVETAAGPLLTDPVEAVFNEVPGVRRSALIGLGAAPRQIPAVVIERRPGATVTLEALRAQAGRFPHTAAIERFFFARRFPVDVRHNAKIHRLELKRRFEGRAGA